MKAQTSLTRTGMEKCGENFCPSAKGDLPSALLMTAEYDPFTWS
jgi:hypothetical protein